MHTYVHVNACAHTHDCVIEGIHVEDLGGRRDERGETKSTAFYMCENVIVKSIMSKIN